MESSAAPESNHQPAPAIRRWHNHVPAWIPQESAYQALPRGVGTTLQTIADACNPPGPDGSLVGAYGGQELIRRSRCSARTFWRHLDLLVKHGYVIVLVRGGRLGNRNVSSEYGIPGHRGALDAAAAKRLTRHMCRGLDGRYRPEDVEWGQQVPMWSEEGATPASPTDPDPPRPCVTMTHGKPDPRVSKCHTGPCVTVTHPVCQNGTVPSPIGSGLEKPMVGASRSNSRKPGKPRMPTIRPDDFHSTDSILALHARAVAEGLVTDSEHGRLQFVSAVEHSLAVTSRDGGDPCRLLAYLVNGGRWMLITQAEEDRAVARLKRHFHGESGDSRPSQPDPPADQADHAEPHRDPAELSPAQLETIRRIIEHLDGIRFEGSYAAALCRQIPDVTHAQAERIISQLTADQRGPPP